MPAKTPALKALGARIHQLRIAAELTQLSLAHKIGLKGDDAGSYICRVEQGSQEPRIDTLRRIAKALKVSIDALLVK